jgi:hypothetical protein
MKEELLHFIWQSKLLSGNKLFTTEGEPIQIIKYGLYNKDAGPDFMNVRIKIGKTEWAGNLEMHINSSEWMQHRHQLDRAYDNVILHVVYHHDKPVLNIHGQEIPTLELKNLLPPSLLRKYAYLLRNKHTIACEPIFKLPELGKVQLWLERLLVERLERKCNYLNDLLIRTNHNWEQSFYLFTARYFGMKTNAQPFEWLAERIPLIALAKHKNNATQILAMLMGTAGLINEKEQAELHNEFLFLQKKYAIEALPKHVWKFSQTRPSNFPTIRIKQFAALIHQSSHLFSKVLQAKTITELQALYALSGEGKLSNQAIQLILINASIPALFLYGKKMNQPELGERALLFIEQLKAEPNSNTKFWELKGIKAQNAAQSQALLQLKQYYCDELACLHCNFGQYSLLHE